MCKKKTILFDLKKLRVRGLTSKIGVRRIIGKSCVKGTRVTAHTKDIY